MKLQIDPFAVLICLGFILFLVFIKFFFFSRTSSQTLPVLKCSNLSYFTVKTWRQRAVVLPQILKYVSLFALIGAFIDPHIIAPEPLKENSHPPLLRDSIALYLVLDISGSMAETITLSNNVFPKINYLKEVTTQFIQNRPNDLMGIVSFARVPHVLAPLTLDKKTLIDTVNHLDIVKNREDDGTAMGYAIYKTAALLASTRELSTQFDSPYIIKGAALILVTDGFQDPSRLDRGNKWRTLELDDAAQFAKQEHIRLYIVGINPALSTETFAPQRKLLQKISEDTGGNTFLISDAYHLKDIYNHIDGLEKGKIRQDEKETLQTFHIVFSGVPLLLGTACMALLLALYLENSLLRRFP